MLISLVEAVSCENPQCAEFAKVVDQPRTIRSYYCPTCSKTSTVRAVDAHLLNSRNEYAEFLRRLEQFESLPG